MRRQLALDRRRRRHELGADVGPLVLRPAAADRVVVAADASASTLACQRSTSTDEATTCTASPDATMRSKASTPSDGRMPSRIAAPTVDSSPAASAIGDSVRLQRRQRGAAADAAHRERFDGDGLVAVLVGDRDVEHGEVVGGGRPQHDVADGASPAAGGARAPARTRTARRTCRSGRSRGSAPGRCPWRRPCSAGCSHSSCSSARTRPASPSSTSASPSPYSIARRLPQRGPKAMNGWSE